MLELPLLPNSRCSLIFGQKVKITGDMICAGGEGRDACSGNHTFMPSNKKNLH